PAWPLGCELCAVGVIYSLASSWSQCGPSQPQLSPELAELTLTRVWSDLGGGDAPLWPQAKSPKPKAQSQEWRMGADGAHSRKPRASSRAISASSCSSVGFVSGGRTGPSGTPRRDNSAFDAPR